MEHSEPPVDNELLLQAFQTFSEASLQLEKAYSELREHTEQLDLELKESNEKLTQSLKEQESISLQLRGILDALTTGILVIDLDGTISDINPCAMRLLNVSREKAHYTEMGFPNEVCEFIHSCLESTMPRYPRREVSIVHEGGDLDLELSFSLVRPEGGGILSVLVLINDVTLIKKLQSQSKRNVRLAAMGEMAAELAHEIRNPLGSIKLFASLLEKDLERRPEEKIAGQVSSGVRVLENIVGNMLTFSADVTPKREQVVVTALLEESVPLFEVEMGRKRISLDYVAPGEGICILGDIDLLKQVVLNLCNNAIKAMEPNGVLGLKTRTVDDFIEIVVSDTGLGIAEDALPKIFDPFFTTFKGGTGLGLSVVNRIVETHGGAIDVKSKVGEGTTVSVSLPRWNETW